MEERKVKVEVGKVKVEARKVKVKVGRVKVEVRKVKVEVNESGRISLVAIFVSFR